MSGQLLHLLTSTGLHQSLPCSHPSSTAEAAFEQELGAPQPSSRSSVGSRTDLWPSLSWLSVTLSALPPCSGPIQGLGVGVVVVLAQGGGERGKITLSRAAGFKYNISM